MSKQDWKPGNMLYPVPVIMVSCQKEGGKPNIITAAWCGTTCSSPAMLYVSIRPDRYSHHIIKETGEFVANLVTEDLTFATDYCGVKSGRDTDKFKDMKLTPLKSKKVRCPGIEESLAGMEIAELLQSKIRDILPSLSEKEAYILEHRLLTDDPVTLREIGERYNVTRERVRQLEARLLQKLKTHLSTDIQDFSEDWISH